MRISIWDMDWFGKYSFLPNYKVQKIASFHKQKGDLINFITEKEHLNFDYDTMYIVKENKLGPFPPSKYIDKINVKLIGKDFKFYDNYYELEPIIEMVRPDYMLYDIEERNILSNASMIQLLHNKTFLPLVQNPENVTGKGRKRSIFVDDMIWELPHADVVKYLIKAKEYEAVAFMHPIDLLTVTSPDIWPHFLALDFNNGTRFKFRNNVGSEFEEVKILIDRMAELKAKNPHVHINGFPVKAVLYNHWIDANNGIKDLKRLLKIINYAKQKQVNIIAKTPNDRFITPYWFFFDIMETWTTMSLDMSYIEIMTMSLSQRTGLTWTQILNKPQNWSVPRVDFLLHVLTKYPEILPYTIRKWGDNCLEINSIDFKEVVKFVNYFDREKILENINNVLKRGEEL